MTLLGEDGRAMTNLSGSFSPFSVKRRRETRMSARRSKITLIHMNLTMTMIVPTMLPTFCFLGIKEVV